MADDALSRALRLYRSTATSRSALLLVAVNLIPLVGVSFFGWSLLTILVLYWLENGIVGFWNVPKILLARGATVTVVPPVPDDAVWAAGAGDLARAQAIRASWDQARQAQQRAIDAAAERSGPHGASGSSGSAVSSGVHVFGESVGGGAGRAGLAVFFLVHYGMFWLVHGVFIFALPMFLGGGPLLDCQFKLVPGGTPGGFPGFPDPVEVTTCQAFGALDWGNVLLAAGALFLSHGASFLFNYIGRAEYLTASPMGQMFGVYGRVVILHLTIIFGAFLIAGLGAPIGALLILIVLKTAFDLGLHLREHRAADRRIPSDIDSRQTVQGS